MQMIVSEIQKRRFEKHINCNKSIFLNPVVKHFFQKDENIHSLVKALDGNLEAKRELEENFRKHFFRIRFVSFLISIINYSTINLTRLSQNNDIHYQLTFDHPTLDREDGTTLGEILHDSHELPLSEPIISDPAKFQSYFNNEGLAQAFARLSLKQQLITTLRYAMCYQDNEIAKFFGVSQQAVSKTRNLALRKLRIALRERG